MPITVNADDFGADATVNNAITECFLRGYIDRTTLMCNMPFAKEAMEEADKKGFISKVGVHLNITSGVPKSEAIRFNLLFCDEDGVFNAGFTKSTKTRLVMNSTCTKSVYREFAAQLSIYKELGGTLWHVDSHHHVHTDASVYKALKMCYAEFPIESVRLSRNLYRGGNPLIRAYKEAFNRGLDKDKVARSEQYFGSYSDLCEYLKISNLEELKREIATGSSKYEAATRWAASSQIEIMVHPSYDKGGNPIDITHDSNISMAEIGEYISYLR